METYVLKKESPADLAKKYTGDPGRYVDLFSVNELTPSVDGMTGKPAFQEDEWREGRRITIPNSWTRPGAIGRVALTDKTVGTVGWGPHLLDSWEAKHPQWSGTNYTYWSIRVDASLKLLAKFPPNETSDAARRCLAKSDYWSKMKAFLLTWNKPSEFVNAFTVGISRGKNSAGLMFNLEPEGVWYANPGDGRIANAAATRFATTQCAHEWTRTLESKPPLNPAFPTRAVPRQRFAGEMAGPSGTVGKDPEHPFDFGDDELGTGERDTSTGGTGSTCTPGGAEVTSFKPYYYVVQSDDIGNFWKIPGKFNMPTSKDQWQRLRNANLNWAGGFVMQNDACVLAGLQPGAKLRVPADWQEPKSNVTIVYPKDDTTCGDGMAYYGGKCVPKGDVPGIDPVNLTGDDSGTTVLALLAVVGLAAVGGVYLYKQRSKR